MAEGEYGRHWNFFLTLAAVKLMTAVAPVPRHLALPAGDAVVVICPGLLVKRFAVNGQGLLVCVPGCRLLTQASVAAGLAVAAAHQAALSWGLADVAHSAHRGTALLSLNKEGLISLPGYAPPAPTTHCLQNDCGRGIANVWLCILSCRPHGNLQERAAVL